MNYQTFEPSAELTDFVKCYWLLEAPKEDNPQRQTIVPDGCMEMIFHFGDLYYQFLNDETMITQPRSFVFGQITKSLELIPSGLSGIVAARFQPNGFAPFQTIPIEKMENRAVAMNELYGEEGVKLEQDVLKAISTEERIAIIEKFLMNKLTSQKNIDAIARSSVEALLKLKGQTSVDELAEQLGINRRQLERRFASSIGLSPKQLSKIIRLQATLKMLEQKQFSNLTALAYENGYFDQAHFIKDFKEFTGMSPSHFYSDSLKMTTLFIGTD